MHTSFDHTSARGISNLAPNLGKVLKVAPQIFPILLPQGEYFIVLHLLKNISLEVHNKYLLEALPRMK